MNINKTYPLIIAFVAALLLSLSAFTSSSQAASCKNQLTAKSNFFSDVYVSGKNGGYVMVQANSTSCGNSSLSLVRITNAAKCDGGGRSVTCLDRKGLKAGRVARVQVKVTTTRKNKSTTTVKTVSVKLKRLIG